MKKDKNPAILVCVTLVSACLISCGGGGSGDSDTPSVSATLLEINEEARVSESAKTVRFAVNATWSPTDGLYADLTWSGEAIAQATWVSTVGNRADISVDLKHPGNLVPGLYESSISFKVCVDEMCQQQVRNSPVRIPVVLTVRSAAPVQVSWSPNQIAEIHQNLGGSPRPTDILVELVGEFSEPPHVNALFSESVIESVSTAESTTSQIRMQVRLMPTREFEDGTHEGFVGLELCYTVWCVNKVLEESINIPVSYSIRPPSALPELGIEPLILSSTHSLSHNVVLAEYSGTDQTVVMAATYPINSIHLFDLETREELSVPLTFTPITLSVSPDGMTAAIGHDGYVSLIDLGALRSLGTTTPTVYDVPFSAAEVVIDGKGFVHVFPSTFPPGGVISINVGTGARATSTSPELLRTYFKAALHPSGDYIYSVTASSPSDLHKLDTTTTPVSYKYDSPYHGHHDVCDGLWMSDDGSRIFTPCGNIFSTSISQAGDLLHQDQLGLWFPEGSRSHDFRIRSLSSHENSRAIALVEYHWRNCPTKTYLLGTPCRTHLATYDYDTLVRTSVYSFAPMQVDDAVYGQEGLFVFQGFDGARTFVISKLEDVPNPAVQYYLSEI